MGRNLKRIALQSGCEDRMHRSIEGIFEILVDQDRINDLMKRASGNKTSESTWGGVTVRFQKATKDQADFLLEHPDQSDFTKETI